MRRSTRLSGVFALLALVACAGPSRQHSIGLNQRIAARDWRAAVAALDAAKGEYGSHNELLWWLDKAIVLHDAGRYAESDALLDLAEQRMEDLYTVSLSKGAATFLVNDAAQDYAGQVHERVLLHVLRSLNFAYLGKTDDAVVEARKVTAFLAALNDGLGAKRLEYRDDAFAQFLSGLFFEDQGRTDDARICFDASRAAYAWYPQVLGTSPPELAVASAADARAPSPELLPAVLDSPQESAPALVPGAMEATAASSTLAPAPAAGEDGELVFLHYAGVAPRKETRTLQVAWRDAIPFVQASDESREDPRVKNALVAGIAANAITFAIPVLVQDRYAVQGSQVSVGPVRAVTALVEDVSAIAQSAYQASLPLVQAKAISRATIKFLVTRLAEQEAKRHLGNGVGSLLGMAARAAAAATETADTRGWRALPAQFRMARLRVPAGRQDVRIRYLSGGGMALWEEIVPGVVIRPGRRTYVHVRTAN
jgi:hypothetical protein